MGDKEKELREKIKALESQNKRLQEIIHHFLFILTGLLKMLGLTSFEGLKTMSGAKVAKTFLAKITKFEKLNFAFADYSIAEIELRLQYLFQQNIAEYTQSVLPQVEKDFLNTIPKDAGT